MRIEIPGLTVHLHKKCFHWQGTREWKPCGVETFENLLINHLNWKCSLIIKNTNNVNSTRETPNKNLFVQLFFKLFPNPRILIHFSSEADAWCFLCRQAKSISRWWTRSISPSNLLHLFSNIRFCCRCWSSSFVRLSRSSAKYLG